MRGFRSWVVLGAFAVGLLFPRAGHASDLLIGQLSFDDLGTGDAFDLDNFTDGLVNPDGIADNELFSGSLSVDIQGIGTQVYTFSDIDSLLTGAVSPTIVVLPYSDDILSATLTLTLSNSTGVNIFDDSGNSAVADLLTIPDTPVTPGVDLTFCDAAGDPCSPALIYVETAPPAAATPEPDSIWLVATGIGGAITMLRRRCWQKV